MNAAARWIATAEQTPEPLEVVLYEDDEGWPLPCFFNGVAWFGHRGLIAAPTHWHAAPPYGPARQRIGDEIEAAWKSSQERRA